MSHSAGNLGRMKTPLLLAAAALTLTACGGTQTPAPATGGMPPAAGVAKSPAAGPFRVACARFGALAAHADAPATTETAMRRDLAALAAIAAPPHLAALFREFAADDLAVINGAKGTIPGLGNVIRELNAACPSAG